tara:strand:+ start:73 stop:633 length:561 start_codon:yes stop_codon:yes gene_type:complete
MALTLNGSANTITPTSAVQPAGSILQFKSTLKTSYTSLNNMTWTDVPGMSVSLSPTATNSRVVVTVTLTYGGSNNQYGAVKIVHNASGSYADLDVGDAFNATDGSAMNPGNIPVDDPTSDYGQYKTYSGSCILEHVPGTTNSVTYKLQYKGHHDTNHYFYINRSQEIGNTTRTQGTSSMTAMEVAV